MAASVMTSAALEWDPAGHPRVTIKSGPDHWTVTSPTGGPVNQTSGFTYTPPPGTTSVSLTIQRVVQAGGATVNPIHFYDGCGEWRTFVGGGARAFE